MSRAKVTNNLPQFLSDAQRKAARGMTQALVIGTSEASVLTPFDTGTLLNSQFCDVRLVDGKIVGVAGYTANYALPVHDPKNLQNFRRATAEKEFLRKGFERARSTIDDVITGALKT